MQDTGNIKSSVASSMMEEFANNGKESPDDEDVARNVAAAIHTLASAM